MADDLKAEIVTEYDGAEFLPGGRVRNTTVVRYMIGRFGPFEHIFDRGPGADEKQRVIDERRRSLEIR